MKIEEWIIKKVAFPFWKVTFFFFDRKFFFVDKSLSIIFRIFAAKSANYYQIAYEANNN